MNRKLICNQPSTMSVIPVDQIMEILCRLPVKSLLRFKCVSKQFRSIINDPKFIKRHLQNRSSDQRLIVQGTLSTLFSVDFNSLDNAVELELPLRFGCRVIGSCDGLLALFHIDDSGICVWNISTKKHKILPNFWRDIDENFYVYDGFGYDMAGDDYKVVRIINFYRSNVTEVSVYSLRANYWRRIDGFPPFKYLISGVAVLVEGALNWLVQVKEGRRNLIVSFGLKTEIFFEVSLPETVPDLQLGIMDLRGFLCLSVINPRQFQFSFDIWMMKEYRVKESWTKLFSFSNETPLMSVHILHITKVLVYPKCGDNLLLFRANGKVLQYDLEKETTEHVVINGWPMFVTNVTVYANSLVSPNVNA